MAFKRKTRVLDRVEEIEKNCPECGGRLPVAKFEVHVPADVACPKCGKIYTATRHGDEVILESISGGGNNA